MYGDRFFGARYFGNRYFGPDAGGAPPADDGISATDIPEAAPSSRSRLTKQEGGRARKKGELR